MMTIPIKTRYMKALPLVFRSFDAPCRITAQPTPRSVDIFGLEARRNFGQNRCRGCEVEQVAER